MTYPADDEAPREPTPSVDRTALTIGFAGHPLLEQTVRLESDVLITDKGHEIFTLFPFEEDMLK